MDTKPDKNDEAITEKDIESEKNDEAKDEAKTENATKAEKNKEVKTENISNTNKYVSIVVIFIIATVLISLVTSVITFKTLSKDYVKKSTLEKMMEEESDGEEIAFDDMEESDMTMTDEDIYPYEVFFDKSGDKLGGSPDRTVGTIYDEPITAKELAFYHEQNLAYEEEITLADTWAQMKASRFNAIFLKENGEEPSDEELKEYINSYIDEFKTYDEEGYNKILEKTGVTEEELYDFFCNYEGKTYFIESLTFSFLDSNEDKSDAYNAAMESSDKIPGEIEDKYFLENY